MSTTLESIYKNLVPSLESGGAGDTPENTADLARHISPTVAHELNNLLTVIQGYADRLLIGHSDNSALQAHLKLITEAARRATAVIRSARTPASHRLPPRLKPHTAEPVTA